MMTYMICDEFGNSLCDEVEVSTYAAKAQELANQRNQSVYAYENVEHPVPGYTYAPYVFEPEDQ